MKSIMVIGLVLIVLGAQALTYQGITYTSREKIIDIGSFEASANTRKTIPLSPIVGGLSLAGGVVLVIIGRKSRSSVCRCLSTPEKLERRWKPPQNKIIN